VHLSFSLAISPTSSGFEFSVSGALFVVLNPAPNLKVLGLLQVKKYHLTSNILQVSCLAAKALYVVHTGYRVLLLDLCSASPF